ncbi:hypothetical protein BJ912DRAFT_275571 [Pholiota molesta]|nr:hypothetical protein BJ912DRAFT_275571 [Pholiota molesta]
MLGPSCLYLMVLFVGFPEERPWSYTSGPTMQAQLDAFSDIATSIAPPSTEDSVFGLLSTHWMHLHGLVQPIVCSSRLLRVFFPNVPVPSSCTLRPVHLDERDISSVPLQSDITSARVRRLPSQRQRCPSGFFTYTAPCISPWHGSALNPRAQNGLTNIHPIQPL